MLFDIALPPFCFGGIASADEDNIRPMGASVNSIFSFLLMFYGEPCRDPLPEIPAPVIFAGKNHRIGI
jgi:hypothetical protein